MNGENRFQWGRIDEVLVFIAGAIFVAVLGVFTELTTEAIAALAGQLITVVGQYVKAGIQRQVNGNGNNGGSSQSMTPGSMVTKPGSVLPAVTSAPEPPSMKLPRVDPADEKVQ